MSLDKLCRIAVLVCVVTFCSLSGVAVAVPSSPKLTGTLTFSDVNGSWDHHGNTKVNMMPDTANGGWVDDGTSTLANSFVERIYKVGANSDPICAADGQLILEYNAAGEGVWSQLPPSIPSPQFTLRPIDGTYVELHIDAPEFEGTFMTTYNVYDANHNCVGTNQEIIQIPLSQKKGRFSD